MAKFVGTIGYATMDETAPGVYSEQVEERRYVGDIVKNTNRWQSSGQVNDDFRIDNQISIIADPYANENFYAMKYVLWMGKAWKIDKAEIQRPRILLSLGDCTMDGRYNLQTLLELTIGSKNVYFQPPPNIQLKYPCIVYDLADVDSRYANNKVYLYRKKYQVTIIDMDPDSEIPDVIARLPLVSFVSRYTEDNLNHTRFNMYY